MSSTRLGMDFSNVGTTERVGDAFRAHVNLRINGQQRNAYGPRRPDEEAAKDDLESMRGYRRPSVARGTVALPFRD